MGNQSAGEFEQLVLLAILQVGDGAYAVPIIQRIEARTGRTVSHAGVYVALRRLEDKGLATSRLEDATPKRGGRRKRYFDVAPHAVTLLRESRDALLSMWEGLEPTP